MPDCIKKDIYNEKYSYLRRKKEEKGEGNKVK